jgi:regulator of sirC expression with transglutaminase-like and TPR domain
MNSSDTQIISKPLPENERAALIKLLGDDDPVTYPAIRRKIISQGPSACEWLRPHLLSDDALLRRHATEIIRHFEKISADNEFLGFCLQHGEDLDLEKGALLLARTQHPQINLQAYSALLDNYAGEIRERMPVAHRAEPLLTHINEHLYARLGFRGNEENYYDPANSFLNRVLDRRTGNPINLCLVYMLLARRLRLPIVGIGLPGHFLCRYQSTSDEVFIDAFDRGKLMTKADCVQYLVRGNYDLRDEYLAPVSSRRMLTRICGNLHQVYLRLGLEEEMTRFQRYLVALAR